MRVLVLESGSLYFNGIFVGEAGEISIERTAGDAYLMDAPGMNGVNGTIEGTLEFANDYQRETFRKFCLKHYALSQSVNPPKLSQLAEAEYVPDDKLERHPDVTGFFSRQGGRRRRY